MGGKTATSQQSVAIPPQVLAQYSSVNQRADQTANTPFQQYSDTGSSVAPDYNASNAGSFVAPINSEQQAGISGTNAAAGEAQPYFGAATGVLGNAQSGVNPINQAATGLAAGSAQAVNPSDLDAASIQKYMSPYVQDVAGSTAALLNQNNQQAQAGQLGNAITSGAFGGDRTGIAAANLSQQQNLANANIYSNILNQGYTNAQGVAQQQQGVGLAAGQANRAALGTAAQTLSGVGQTTYGEGANTASELAGLGSGAQSAALSGAQAQISAGTVQQQTQQAQDAAQYNQFLQQESYPFQVDQWLAGIAEGTGALSGSTTTTTQPGGFFSDERLKEDMEPIGRTFDGQPIYRYKMKGDSRDRIGLSAQKVEKKHPEAVGVAGGFRYVDYGKATDEAANRGHFYSGGVVPFRRAAMAYGGGPDDSDGGLGAVLAAQRNMYASGQGGQQRNIAAPSASHQLAVASGTPAPPPSGSSHVTQAVGLGKDAYKAYKYFNKPSATPSGVDPGNVAGAPAPSSTADGVTTNFEAPAADAGSPGTTTTFDAGLQSADTSGLGAADASAAAPAATDAAASGAADAAAGAGADATAGAATGAVASGAADAAATEAAALAAEYAAADAAVALAAAKRGGRIRGKFAGGGTPYGLDGEQLDIPDDQTSVHLQTAGPIQKQPTGLQTAMKMGDPNQASGLAGSIFSNQGMAAGGLAGRRGYDDGGAPTDDDTVDTASSDSAPMDDSSSAGVAGSSKPSLWGKVKKYATAENVVPLLTGLAAMGTAKTRSPGVALAAGLGAGSQSYLDTRASQAKTAEEQQRARGLDLANQLSGLRLGVAQKAFSPPPSGTVPRQAAPQTAAPTDENSAPQPSSSAAGTAAGIAAQYRHQFFVNTARTPEEQAQKDEAIKKDWAVGGTMFQSQADNDFQGRVQRDQQNARNTAQQLADARFDQYNDPNLSQADKQVALTHYNALRQWTGDGQEIQGGVVKNSRRGLPEIGTIAQQGFTPAEQAAVMARAQELVSVPNTDGTSTQMPAWQAHHAASPEAYAQSLMVNSTAPPSIAVNPAPRTAASAPVQSPSRRSEPPAITNAPARTVPPVATPAAQADPYLGKALSDPIYDLHTPPVQSGVTATPASLDQQKVTVESRAHLLKDSQDATTASAAALQYLNAAKSIMDSKGATVGAYGGLLAKASRVLGGGPQSQNYQELAKYLGNAAVQSGKANFPNATQSEVGLQLNELSANKDMDAPTINDILDTNIRNSQYALDTAKRVNTYLDKGKDPQKFATWNQQYYPREKIVNTPTEGAVPVKSRAEAMSLKPGTVFITPDGRRLVR